MTPDHEQAAELVRRQGYDPAKHTRVVDEIAALLKLPEAERPTDGATRDQRAAIGIIELCGLDEQIAELEILAEAERE